MDNGEEIPGLNEDLSFAGAKMMEWVSGFVMFMVVSELFKLNPAHSMPVLLVAWLGTTLGLATVRKRFPDEERGVRNAAMVGLGFAPPGVPPPAAIQPHWSGQPCRRLESSTYFEQLNLADLFARDIDEGSDDENAIAAIEAEQQKNQ